MPTHKETINAIEPIKEDENNILLTYEDYAFIERTEGDYPDGTLHWRGKKVYRACKVCKLNVCECNL